MRNTLRFAVTVLSLSFFLLLPKETLALLEGDRVILIDDYDHQDGINYLKGQNRGEEGCIPGFVTGEGAFGKSGASLSLDYDVTASASSSYFLIPLGVADLTEESYLSFWVKSEAKGGASRIEFMIEFHEDTNGDGKYVVGKDVTEGVLVSHFVGKVKKGGWQKAVIPLSRFRRIRQWNHILEMAFVFENKWRIGKGRLLVDNLLLGSHYPEGLEGREIPMQNRVSSFKIGGRIVNPEMKLKRKPTSLALTLTFIDPYLEEIRFEETEVGGSPWRRIQSFYDHSAGGVYESPWELTRARSRRRILIRAVGMNVLGGETELAGPYPIHFD